MFNTNKNYNIDNIARELLRHLSAKQLISKVSAEFSAMKTNVERVNFVLKLLDDYDLLPALAVDGKNNGLAQDFRQKGNEMFKVRKNADALEFYTKSVAVSEEGSEQLALAYANRSAALFDAGFYKECLVDIDRAFKNNYPENLKAKLITRQEKTHKLKSKQIAQNYFEPVSKIPDKYKNDSIECAADSVKIEHSETEARHVVATKDIAIGEIVAVEKPFCHILIERFYSHCHECLKLCYTLIPCLKCTQAMFCSIECKDKSSSYHKYECPILATTRKLEMDRLKLLPMKIALIIKDQYDVINNEYSLKENDVYRSDRYREIHNLVANTDRRSTADLFDRSVTAAIIFHLIKNYTSFFEKTSEENMFKDLVLLHLQTAACNFHEISEVAENSAHVYEPDEIGAGAYSFLSMFNHSCSPNVVRDCHGPVIVVRAIESIEKGQQCYDNYGYHHAVMTKSERRSKLKKQYFFDCTCEVCENDWPLYKNLREIKSDALVINWDLVKLQEGDLEAAKKVLIETLPKMAELENLKPNKNFAELQEIIKQCFALFGNIRRTL